MNQQSAEHTVRVKVRHYEMDSLGHVNNAVYLHYVEEAAIDHARALGFDEARRRELGGAWVVRRHEVDFRVPAVAGDELDVTTRIVSVERVQAARRTTIVRVGDNALVAEALTFWVWVGVDGRPKRLPTDVGRSCPRRSPHPGAALPRPIVPAYDLALARESPREDRRIRGRSAFRATRRARARRPGAA